MKVRLISRTVGVNGETAQELISYIARVSNPENQSVYSTAARLLRRLIKWGHVSPFEHAFLTIEVTTSRVIAAQILRHRSMYFQEFSQRYSEAYSYEVFEARRQDTKNRQNSIDDMDEGLKSWFRWAQQRVWDLSFTLYNAALALGIAKEQARVLLPLNTTTVMYITGNVRSWMHWIGMRSKEGGAQGEHIAIAEAVKEIFTQEFPVVAEALWAKEQ